MKKVLRSLGWFIAIACIVYSIHSCHIDHYEEREDASITVNICSLKTESSIHGAFFLGIGTIDSKDYYVFYQKTQYGGLHREMLPCADCTIYEGYPTPHIVEYGTEDVHYLHGKAVDSDFRIADMVHWRHEIYVPTGTITQNINLN